VSDACGAADDLVLQSVTGYVYRTGSIEELAAQLSRFSVDLGMSERLGEAARGAVSEWGPTQNVEAFVQACTLLADDS
jgi:hypothetical protein